MNSFGERARRLSGTSARLLGWRPEDFWQATPAELATLLEAFLEEMPEPLHADDLKLLMEAFPDG